MILTQLYQYLYKVIVSLYLKIKNRKNIFYNVYNNKWDNFKMNFKKAENQKHIVLSVFQKYPYRYFSAYDIWLYLVHRQKTEEHTPLTSIRRAITNLTIESYIYKTDYKVMGNGGRKTNTWKLK